MRTAREQETGYADQPLKLAHDAEADISCAAALAMAALAVRSRLPAAASAARPRPPARCQVTGLALSGKVHGGQSPVKTSTVQLYAAGTTGYGSAATLLASTSHGQQRKLLHHRALHLPLRRPDLHHRDPGRLRLGQQSQPGDDVRAGYLPGDQRRGEHQ